MGFKCGIIGLPNVGKSTLFNLLTQGNSAVANFPFCTIKPNIGIVSVCDKRINNLAQIISPKKIVNACIEFIDIAGLVKGASKGEGLGNQFLNDIREAHAIVHVVRCFKDNNISHIYDTVQPVQDIDIINTELILSDFDLCEKTILQLQKKILKNQTIEKKINVLKKCLNHLKQCLMLKTLDLNVDEKKIISSQRFLTLKPTMYVANVDEGKDSYYFVEELNKIAQKENSIVIPIHAHLELDLSKINDDKERKYFMKEFNIKTSSLNAIIESGYQLLNLITFFTAGVKEIRAWAILNGSTSLEAAHKIHSDFSKGFIRAQIIKYIDFIKYKSENKIKEVGKFRTEGKNYRIQDGDIVHFLFNI